VIIAGTVKEHGWRTGAAIKISSLPRDQTLMSQKILGTSLMMVIATEGMSSSRLAKSYVPETSEKGKLSHQQSRNSLWPSKQGRNVNQLWIQRKKNSDGSVLAQTLNDNLKELQVLESKRNAIRKGLVYDLLNPQDTILCSCFGSVFVFRAEVGRAE
jgi:hypothetical protein